MHPTNPFERVSCKSDENSKLARFLIRGPDYNKPGSGRRVLLELQQLYEKDECDKETSMAGSGGSDRLSRL